MRKIGLGFIIGLIVVFVFRYYEFKRTNRESVVAHTQLIQQQLRNVGKLVVTEGHYTEVYTYKDQKEFFGEYFSFEKKALVVVNASVQISYDLHQLTYDIDQKNRVLHILNVPQEEIRIDPELTFYDINDSYFNPFTEKDYNIIQGKIRARLRDKIMASPLKTNARNRLISELSTLYILTNSLAWTIAIDAPNFPETEVFKEQKVLPKTE